MNTPSNANTSGLYLLVKRGLYYRPDAMGYTGIKDHAGRYSKEDAEDHSDPASGVTMVSEAEAAEFSPNCFDDLARAHLLKQRDAAEARADRLAKALEALQDLFAREGECSMERFERIAEMFRKDTGYLAPGKDPGMLSQQPEGDELRRIYDDWYAGKIKTARAAQQQEKQL